MTIEESIRLIILLKLRLRKKLTDEEQLALRVAIMVMESRLDTLRAFHAMEVKNE